MLNAVAGDSEGEESSFGVIPHLWTEAGKIIGDRGHFRSVLENK
jgi:hypothetical protein